MLSDENVWNLVPETDNEAIYVLMTKANHWVATAAAAQKKLETVEEIKSFIFVFDLQGMMEILLHKDKYKQYWRLKKTNLSPIYFLFVGNGLGKSLGIWTLLECVNQDDLQLN